MAHHNEKPKMDEPADEAEDTPEMSVPAEPAAESASDQPDDDTEGQGPLA